MRAVLAILRIRCWDVAAARLGTRCISEGLWRIDSESQPTASRRKVANKSFWITRDEPASLRPGRLRLSPRMNIIRSSICCKEEGREEHTLYSTMRAGSESSQQLGHWSGTMIPLGSRKAVSRTYSVTVSDKIKRPFFVTYRSFISSVNKYLISHCQIYKDRHSPHHLQQKVTG
jgi:hypothetical protein